MGAGKRAFKGDSGPVLQEAILKQTPSPARGVNPEIPAKLEKIVSKLLEKNREARYPAASDVRADFETLKRQMAPKHLVRRWAVGGVAALIISGTVFWFARRQPTSSAPPDLKLRQLTTNSSENRVISGAISPDGKYLAYTDYLGVHLKLIETGEIRTIPPPEALKDRTLEWEFACWFPDSSRILATAHPPNSKTNPSYSSSGASIWVYPVVGGTPAKLRDDAMGWSVSPDGTLVSFTTNPGRFGDGESWLMQLDGKGAQKQLETDENSAITGFGWSPDAQRVLYSRYDGSKDHWVSRKLKGGPVTPVFPPSETREINDLGVLPDGRLIYSLEESRAGAAARAL